MTGVLLEPWSEAWGCGSKAAGQEAEFGHVAAGRVTNVRFLGTVAVCVCVCVCVYRQKEGGDGFS